MTKGKQSLHTQSRKWEFEEEEEDPHYDTRQESYNLYDYAVRYDIMKEFNRLYYPTTEITLDEYEENKDKCEYFDYYKESRSTIMHEEMKTVDVCIKVPKYVWLHDGYEQFVYEFRHFPNMTHIIYDREWEWSEQPERPKWIPTYKYDDSTQQTKVTWINSKD